MPAGRGSEAVEAYLDGSSHARLDEVRALRDLVLSADERISEHVKWNAPSFVVDGEDRVTMRLQPGDRVQLVLHRGVRVRDDVDGVPLRRPGRAGRRGRRRTAGSSTSRTPAMLAARHDELVDLVRRWVQA